MIIASALSSIAESTALYHLGYASPCGKVFMARKTFLPFALAYQTPSSISFFVKFRPSKFRALVASLNPR